MLKALGTVAVVLAASTLPACAEMQRFGSFVIYDDHPELLALVGPIQQNAPIDLRRALRKFPDVKLLALHSDGGDVTAGLLVAQEVFDRGIDTVISEGSGCYSACAYIYFAGENRSVEGELGVHQMANAVGDQYSVQVAISDMLDTLAEFDVPPVVISEMLRTAPEDIRVYDAEEASKLGLNRTVTAEVTSEPVQIFAAPPQSALLPPPSVPSTTTSIPADVPSPAAIYLAAGGPDGAVPVYGHVWWTRTADPDGGDMVVAEVSVPLAFATLEAKVTWRDNKDASLPADAMLHVNFSYAGPGSPDRVRKLPGVLAKAEPMTVGRPIVGASAVVQGSEFLFALSSQDADITENSILLTERYFDLALVLESGRNAILTLEKDDTATDMFRDVVESWVE
ncbi:hypothetical protein [Devosia naphthalenivorans]|uniref:COG3904 family protein n=1 Tax=Devosia naphthalenivorans TaxID=2082392 RepID=UPI000D376B16|nr:hypothetical protein [Devosia naphthalenivorans]